MKDKRRGLYFEDQSSLSTFQVVLFRLRILALVFELAGPNTPVE